MAIGWLTVLKALPWRTILNQAPTVVDAANRLLTQARRKRADGGSQDTVHTLLERIEALEEHDRADAAVMKQLAEELAALARASQVIALRMRILLFLSLMALLASLVALGIVLSR